MSFIDTLDRARAVLERQGRLSAQARGRELEVEADELEELVDVQQIAPRGEGARLGRWTRTAAIRGPQRIRDPHDAYVASVVALHELAPDAMVGQPLYHLADEPHGTLAMGHSFDTLAIELAAALNEHDITERAMSPC